METWQDAEHYVGSLIKGKRTPGSGAKRIKGDVRVGKRWIIEVKHTTKTSMTVNRDWLDKLEREQDSGEIALAVAFKDSIHFYVQDTGPLELPVWKSVLVRPEEMPNELTSTTFIYRYYDEHTFKQLVRSE